MKTLFSIFLFVLISFQLKAQNIALTKADRLYQLYAYSEAVDSYEKLLKRNADDEYLIQQIAYCYEKMEAYNLALVYFEKHIKSKRARYEDFYKYATLLLIDGQFERAIEEFKRCIQKMPDDRRPYEQIERINEFDRLNLLQNISDIINVDFNTRFADMSPAYYKDSIAFISARDSLSGYNYSWNNEPFLDIYEFTKSNKGEIKIEKMPGVNTKYHEGPLAFTNNFETIWFTRNNQNFSGKSGDETNNLRIYRADWNGKKWGDVEAFQFNSNDYSVGHPAFSSDGNTMYFTSDMDGSIGQTDLFKVKRIEVEDKNGNLIPAWSEPENLGHQFNTEGKEMLPFFDSLGVMYFSSDGLIGFGGLDVYAAIPVADSFKVINIGQPINSTYDDFSFIVANDFRSGYICSNRPGGKGGDDIYSFSIGLQHLYIYVKTVQESSPVPNATVNYSVDKEDYQKGKTEENGFVILDVAFYKNFYFESTTPNFLLNSELKNGLEISKVSDTQKTVYIDNATIVEVLVLDDQSRIPLAGFDWTITLSNGDTLNFVNDPSNKIKYEMEKTKTIDVDFFKADLISKGTSIDINVEFETKLSEMVKLESIYKGKTFTLDNLYYDLNSTTIREDAVNVLDQLYYILMENPTINIEFSSYTDSRGNKNYNQRLSQRRAQNAVDYLIDKGIDKDRMVAVGYGESELLNECEDGVECSEEEHQINRRTEIKILDF